MEMLASGTAQALMPRNHAADAAYPQTRQLGVAAIRA
jgi:hypothetical protein